MNDKLKENYLRLRQEMRDSTYYNATRAIQGARNLIEADKIKEQFENEPRARLQIVPDEIYDYDTLFGEAFCPIANPDINPNVLKKQEKAELDRCNREGVYGIVGEYRCPHCETWLQADSVWGFIGDDWKESGYDTDIMRSTLDKLENL